MADVMVVQGRELNAEDIGQIQGLLAEHPDWGRTRFSEELCRRWDWRNARGRITEQARLQLRGEFFNMLNHTQFGQPNTAPLSPTFGLIANNRQRPREVQIRPRVQF